MKTVQKTIQIYEPGDVLEIVTFPKSSTSRKKMVADSARVLVTSTQIAKSGNPSYWVLTDSKKHIRVSADDLRQCMYISSIDMSPLFGDEE